MNTVVTSTYGVWVSGFLKCNEQFSWQRSTVLILRSAWWQAGLILSLRTIMNFMCQLPVGHVVDVSTCKRVLLVIACIVIGAAAVSVIVVDRIPFLKQYVLSFLAVKSIVEGAFQAAYNPLRDTMTLGIVGKDHFDNVAKKCEAANHAGQVHPVMHTRWCQRICSRQCFSFSLLPAQPTSVPQPSTADLFRDRCGCNRLLSVSNAVYLFGLVGIMGVLTIFCLILIPEHRTPDIDGKKTTMIDGMVARNETETQHAEDETDSRKDENEKNKKNVVTPNKGYILLNQHPHPHLRRLGTHLPLWQRRSVTPSSVPICSCAWWWWCRRGNELYFRRAQLHGVRDYWPRWNPLHKWLLAAMESPTQATTGRDGILIFKIFMYNINFELYLNTNVLEKTRSVLVSISNSLGFQNWYGLSIVELQTGIRVRVRIGVRSGVGLKWKKCHS